MLAWGSKETLLKSKLEEPSLVEVSKVQRRGCLPLAWKHSELARVDNRLPCTLQQWLTQACRSQIVSLSVTSRVLQQCIVGVQDLHEPATCLDDAGNEISNQSANPDDLPEVDTDRPLPVTFGNKLRYAPTLTNLTGFPRHGDRTLQPLPLPKVGPNKPYPSSLKGTHPRVHQHYQCKDWTSSAVWAAAYREDPRTRHIHEIAIPSLTAGYQL